MHRQIVSKPVSIGLGLVQAGIMFILMLLAPAWAIEDRLSDKAIEENIKSEVAAGRLTEAEAREKIDELRKIQERDEHVDETIDKYQPDLDPGNVFDDREAGGSTADQ